MNIRHYDGRTLCLLLPLFFLVIPFTIATAPNTVLGATWAKLYGGSGPDRASSIQQTFDGGYILAGTSSSFVSTAGWVVKLNPEGTISWQKAYYTNGLFGSSLRVIRQTSDGGYIAAGYTGFLQDIWVLRLDANGTIVWQNIYGGTGNESVSSISETSGGGFIIGGQIGPPPMPQNGFWILKLDAGGAVEWQKSYARSFGTEEAGCNSIQQTSDGGYIAAGYASLAGFWVLKLNSDGTPAWQKSFSGGRAYSAQQTSDGGYVVAGQTSLGAGWGDLWVLKLNADGSIAWQRAYGSPERDTGDSIWQTSDGGYIVSGSTFVDSSETFWIVKLNAAGALQWERSFGGLSIEQYPSSIQQTSNGEYVAIGSTRSNQGEYAIRVLKLDTEGRLDSCAIIGTPRSTVTETAVEGTDTNALIQDTSAPFHAANNLSTDTNGTPSNQCSVFADVPKTHWAYGQIEALFESGITSGCSTNPPFFCPDRAITRGEMAVFMEGSLGVPLPPPCSGTVFNDVHPATVGEAFCGFIEDFALRGITGGCGEGNYCPDAPVTRSQMAVFIEAALGATVPLCAGNVFTDVNPSAVGPVFCGYIEDFASRGITSGCTVWWFCPNDPVTRAQMAVFLVAAPSPLTP